MTEKADGNTQEQVKPEDDRNREGRAAPDAGGFRERGGSESEAPKTEDAAQAEEMTSSSEDAGRAKKSAEAKDAGETTKADSDRESAEASEENTSTSEASEQQSEPANEASDAERAEEAGAGDVERLKKKLTEMASEVEALKKENEALRNRWMRTQADFDNFRKRTNKEKAEARKYRAQELSSDLLETLDNFKRALAVETHSEDGEALKKGMEMVLKKLEAALEKEGVKEIDALGKPFDPHLHQAVMQEESDEYDSGTVIQVLQAGYTLNGRVIRPTMVKVSA